VSAGAPCGGAPIVCQRVRSVPLPEVPVAPSLRSGRFNFEAAPGSS